VKAAVTAGPIAELSLSPSPWAAIRQLLHCSMPLRVGTPVAVLASMNSRNKWELFLLAGAVAISRFVFRSHLLYDLDSVNFALAMGRFDPRVHQPHPPGYFLYICFARLLNTMFHDANLALVVLSIVASCGVVAMIYRIALDWFGARAALFAGILFLVSPLAWFHGTVALTYSVEAFFSALLGYLCWRVFCGRGGFILPTSVILGISAGVRPSSLLFLGPLFLFSLRHATPKARLAGMTVLVLTLATWFLPMIWASGGFGAYFSALASLWQSVPAKDTVFNSSPATSIARACTIAFIYLLSFGAASLVPLSALRVPDQSDRRKTMFTIVWMAPALCFFTFIFLKFVNSGYLLLLSAPACIWLGNWASEWYGRTVWRKPLKLAVVALCAAVNVLIFLASPFYCSYRAVRRFETEFDGVRVALSQFASPDDTLIIGFDSHFLGYRQAGYYLPGFLTLEYPEVSLREGIRVFAMQGRETGLFAGLPLGSYTRFVLFPLPGGGDAYREYLQKVETHLPSQSLRTIRVGGYDFVTAPISALPLLFPQAAAVPEGVYTLLHSASPPVNGRSHQPEWESP
jgi:hypothetical protein